MEWWVWLLIIAVIIVAAIVIWWWWNSRREPSRSTGSGASGMAPRSMTSEAAPLSSPSPAAAASVAAAGSMTRDDLTIIEGVGPKIASVLSDAGISTFAALANADVMRLEQILRDANLPLAKPGSWPAQARLAADGKMDELKALQETLVAGR